MQNGCRTLNAISKFIIIMFLYTFSFKLMSKHYFALNKTILKKTKNMENKIQG